MENPNSLKSNRRGFIKNTIATTIGLSMSPYLMQGSPFSSPFLPVKRDFGKIDFKVTTMGLGGQASIQWTPEGIDPVAIILKAYRMGINYFDTSNYYGPSQMNYGKAFRQLGLVPGEANYDKAKREAIFITSKSGLRFAKGGDDQPEFHGGTNGPKGSKTIDDVRRTLSQIFGDGEGKYPKEAYLDMVLVHTLSKMGEVDAIYQGYDHPDPNARNIGALAALRDVRDGTNRTGLNPDHEVLIRHIGFSGHKDAAVMIEMIQRDTENLIDGMLVAINANDKLYFNMQYNVIPVAAAKKIGIIGMKVFADGAMYTKPSTWSNKPEHVVLQNGSASLPAHLLVWYTLTTPGVHTAIIGIGKISDNPEECQLTQDLKYAQIGSSDMSEEDRIKVEDLASKAKDGKTNYFQLPYQDLTAPREVKVKNLNASEVEISWHTAYAGDAPIDHYEVWRNNELVDNIPFSPQTTKKPYFFSDHFVISGPKQYIVKAVDKKMRVAASNPVSL